MKKTQFEKRKSNKNKFIRWSRKPKQDGSIRYTFVRGDDCWIVIINSATSSSRRNIAKSLIAHRRKFLSWIERRVTSVGGYN